MMISFMISATRMIAKVMIPNRRIEVYQGADVTS